MEAPVAAPDEAYADLYEKFKYLQQQTNRLAAAYTLATQDLEALEDDNKILTAKLVQIRVRRRNLAAQAEATMGSNMTAKALFCRRNRRILRKQFPLVSREKLSAIVADEYDSLSKEAAEQWQREFKSYVPKPAPKAIKEEAAPRSSGSALPSASTADVTTPVKKAPAKPRRKPAKTAAATPTDDLPKPKRPTPKKKAAEKAPDKKPPAKKPRTSPAKTTPAAKAPKRATPTKPKGKTAPKEAPSASKKQDTPSAAVEDDDSSSDSSNTNSSGNSSMAPSDDDSDDNLMHLPTGAFG